MEITINKDIQLRNAVIFEIELFNGEKSLLTTFYNNKDLDFEELVHHTQEALKKCNRIRTVQPTVGSISTGKFNGLFFYEKIEFSRAK